MNTAGRRLAVLAAAVAIACLGLGCAGSMPSMPPAGYFKDMKRTAGEGESEIIVKRIGGGAANGRAAVAPKWMKILIDGNERLRLQVWGKKVVIIPNGKHDIHAEYPTRALALRAAKISARDSVMQALQAQWTSQDLDDISMWGSGTYTPTPGGGPRRSLVGTASPSPLRAWRESDVISINATSSRIVLVAKYTLSGIELSKYMEIPLDKSGVVPSNDNYNTSQPNSAIASTGGGLPKIAVYVTSGADKSMAAKLLAGAGAYKTIGDGLAKAIGGAGKCDAVNLTGDITKAHGAMVGEAQAAAIGRQFGVQYLSIVTISNVKGKSFNLGVKLVDAAAKPVASASAAVDLSNAPGLLQSLAKIAAELVKGIAASAVQSVVQGAVGDGAAAVQNVAQVALVGGASAAPEPAPAAIPVQQSAPAPVGQPVQMSAPAAAAIPVTVRPSIAVYVKGGLGENENKALGTTILVNLVNSGRYRGAERTAQFLAEADKELKARGAAVDDGHISKLGKQFDINFVCVVDVTPVFGEFHVSARMVNVETASTELAGTAASPLKSLSDLEQTSESVAKSMFGQATRQR